MADRCVHCEVRMDGLEVHGDNCPVRGPEIVAENESLQKEVDKLRAEIERLKAWALSQGQSHRNLAVERRDDEEMLATHNALSTAYFALAREIDGKG